MPYITPESRRKFICEEYGKIQTLQRVDEIKLVADKIENCGEFNYVVTLLSQYYIKKHGLKYQNINDVIGALEGAKIELYRRIASKYEDDKIEINGDVNVTDD